MAKRIAIQLFGHLRTFRETFESFQQNIILPNLKAGYEVDVFIHTWNVLEFAGETYHNENSQMRGNKLSEEDLEFVKEHYTPVEFFVEEQSDGKAMNYSMTAVNRLRIENSQKNQVEYDWVIMTRPDILFFTPFVPQSYIETYFNTDLDNVAVPEDCLFVGNNLFGRMNVADPRFVCEWDLIWFSRPDAMQGPIEMMKMKMVPIKYQMNKDFKIKRKDLCNTHKAKKKCWRLELLKLLPYFLVEKEIKRLGAKYGGIQ